jgi:hypothetical protein
MGVNRFGHGLTVGITFGGGAQYSRRQFHAVVKRHFG